MKIKFWGVRGSFAATTEEFSKYGGNTSCVEIIEGQTQIILDAGTGIRNLGKKNPLRQQKVYHILLSHYHLDHISGLPFFRPIHQKNITLNLYGPSSPQQTIITLFSKEFFPVAFRSLAAKVRFHPLSLKKFHIGPFTITSIPINHPNPTLGYFIETHQHRIAYLTDHEPIRQFRHLRQSPDTYEASLLHLLKGTDLLIQDAQFTDANYPAHRGWGHTSWSDAIRLAEKVGVKKLIFFHHDPDQTDQSLDRETKKFPEIHLAKEGETLCL
ncbi:MAG: MBL fold metallo-hydrolase [Deltaproteobacteria bacterium]|nr:MBL fold metallo-hydrolase [Deltaproteobacteria bacterium]